MSPSNMFGSGKIIAPSLPFTSSVVRASAESKEKIKFADWPER